MLTCIEVMKEQYNSAVARHYAAYRPPLHGPTLSQLLDSKETFSIGLDIGCGTGYSAIALANYCAQVFGVDPSEAMLAGAEEHPRVTYICTKGDDLSGMPVRSVGVVTFAGSLCYTKSNELRQELDNVCIPGATVAVYDFEVLLDEVLSSLGIDMPAVGSDYDHAANIVDWTEYSVDMVDTGQLRLGLSSEELVHLLLADSNRLEAFSEKFATPDPYEAVVDLIERMSDTHELSVDIFLARYRYSPT